MARYPNTTHYARPATYIMATVRNNGSMAYLLMHYESAVAPSSSKLAPILDIAISKKLDVGSKVYLADGGRWVSTAVFQRLDKLNDNQGRKYA